MHNSTAKMNNTQAVICLQGVQLNKSLPQFFNTYVRHNWIEYDILVLTGEKRQRLYSVSQTFTEVICNSAFNWIQLIIDLICISIIIKSVCSVLSDIHNYTRK